MITESQNHRMLGAGRGLCGSSSPTLPPKLSHLQQAAVDLVQVGLEYLQRRRLHNLPGQPVPVLSHPQREEVLPRVQTEKAKVPNNISYHSFANCHMNPPLNDHDVCATDLSHSFTIHYGPLTACFAFLHPLLDPCLDYF